MIDRNKPIIAYSALQNNDTYNIKNILPELFIFE